MPLLSLYDEALLAHAQLSRAAWAVVQAWDTSPGISVALVQALETLRAVQHQTPVRCACSSPGCSKDWCTGHCAHRTQGADDGLRP